MIKGIIKDLGKMTSQGKETAVLMSEKNKIQKAIRANQKTRMQAYNTLGMEAYDLYEAGKFSIAELQTYLDKIEEINQEIKRLEEEEQGLEDARIATLNAKEEKKAPEELTNSQQVLDERDRETDVHTVPYDRMKECICGAKVPVEQRMCMECGRKI